MAQQISESGLTLLEAIRAGEVHSPPRMGWNAWQLWRRDFGKRPKQAVDGYSTTTTQESALWKSAMNELHGADWAVQVVSLEVAHTEAPPLAGEPSLAPAAAAGQDGTEEETQPTPATPRARDASRSDDAEAQEVVSTAPCKMWAQECGAQDLEYSLPGLGRASARVRRTGLLRQC